MIWLDPIQILLIFYTHTLINLLCTICIIVTHKRGIYTQAIQLKTNVYLLFKNKHFRLKWPDLTKIHQLYDLDRNIYIYIKCSNWDCVLW